MWPPFQLTSSRPQEHSRKSLSRIPKGVLTLTSFQTRPHSHFLISIFTALGYSLLLRCSARVFTRSIRRILYGRASGFALTLWRNGSGCSDKHHCDQLCVRLAFFEMGRRASLLMILALTLFSSCAKKSGFPEPVIRRLRSLSADWQFAMGMSNVACQSPRRADDCRKYSESADLLEQEIVRLAKQYPGIEEQEPWIKVHLKDKQPR